jgi:hypothetical protein
MDKDALAANMAELGVTRVPIRAAVAGLERYLDDPAYVSGVVRRDATALGDLTACAVIRRGCQAAPAEHNAPSGGPPSKARKRSPSACQFSRR